jgi:hypothetical protein
MLAVLHAPILRLSTRLVSVQEPLPGQVDAVFLYSGDNRHAVAARWFKSNHAHTILLPRRLATRNVALGIVPPRDVFSRQALLELAVEDGAIHGLENPQPRGEWRFARLLDEWLQDHSMASVVVLCDNFESRYVRYVMNAVLSDTDSQRVYVLGLPSSAYDEQNWWRSRRGAVSMFESLMQEVYARCAGEDEDDPVTFDVDAMEESLGRR